MHLCMFEIYKRSYAYITFTRLCKFFFDKFIIKSYQNQVQLDLKKKGKYIVSFVSSTTGSTEQEHHSRRPFPSLSSERLTNFH